MKQEDESRTFSISDDELRRMADLSGEWKLAHARIAPAPDGGNVVAIRFERRV